VAVHSQLSVDDRGAGVGTHPAGAHDVTGAERLIGVVDIRRLEPLEQALVRFAAGREAGARVVACSVSELGARDPERARVPLRASRG
jgi:hypothetical protein